VRNQAELSLAENVQQTKQQGVKRNDPDPRPVEGATNRVDVAGKDPGKHYVWVSTVNDPTLNPGSYRSRGYKFSEYDPDGVQPALGFDDTRKAGDRIEAFGMVLMECSLEHQAKLDAEGQAWANKVESVIRHKDVSDETEAMSPAERAKMRGITTGKRYGGDNRAQWEF
jgi:hypothetical protein